MPNFITNLSRWEASLDLTSTGCKVSIDPIIFSFVYREDEEERWEFGLGAPFACRDENEKMTKKKKKKITTAFAEKKETGFDNAVLLQDHYVLALWKLDSVYIRYVLFSIRASQSKKKKDITTPVLFRLLFQPQS